MNEPWSPLPDHIETAIHDSASLHAEHKTSASGFERFADRIIATLGRPVAVLIYPGLVGLWLVAGVGLPQLGLALDPPPFGWLQLTLTIAAAFMTIVILASQRRSHILASRREQLMLQLAFSSDHKVAKIIALLEELRRDDPSIANRQDRQAAAMAQTSDPQAVVDAIEEAHAGFLAAARNAEPI